MARTKDYNDVLKEAADNFAEIIDITSTANILYEGFAQMGTPTSAAAWQIKRTNTSTLVTDFADGNDNFDNVWDNRTSLTYS